jgi:hypothetical protein
LIPAASPSEGFNMQLYVIIREEEKDNTHIKIPTLNITHHINGNYDK